MGRELLIDQIVLETLARQQLPEVKESFSNLVEIGEDPCDSLSPRYVFPKSTENNPGESVGHNGVSDVLVVAIAARLCDSISQIALLLQDCAEFQASVVRLGRKGKLDS